MKANNKPRNLFKLLLVILAAVLLFIAVLLVSAFRMLQWAQDNGIIDAPVESISMDGWNSIDQGTLEMFSNSSYEQAGAIESIQMEYFMEET